MNIKHIITLVLVLTAVMLSGCDSRQTPGSAAKIQKEVVRLTANTSNRTEQVNVLFTHVRDNIRQIRTSYG